MIEIWSAGTLMMMVVGRLVASGWVGIVLRWRQWFLAFCGGRFRMTDEQRWTAMDGNGRRDEENIIRTICYDFSFSKKTYTLAVLNVRRSYGMIFIILCAHNPVCGVLDRNIRRPPVHGGQSRQRCIRTIADKKKTHETHTERDGQSSVRNKLNVRA